MAERIEFIFDGQLAAENRMDFYESARFQYAAARLTVKLDRYRRTGRFPSKVTRDSNTAIDLKPFRAGSFGIEIIAPVLVAAVPMFLEVPLTALWTYVVERIFKPADEDAIRSALAQQGRLLQTFDDHIASSDEQAQLTLDLLRRQIELGQDLSAENQLLRDRLLAEAERRAYLEGMVSVLSRISAEDDARLVTMAAPLLREMSVPMRRSASQVRVVTEDNLGRREILSADRATTEDVELSVVDPHITTLGINIIQYNKENGWGKSRNSEWEGIGSFAVPADKKQALQARLLAAMNADQIYVQAYFVRSMAGIPLRIIVIDFIDIDKMEGNAF